MRLVDGEELYNIEKLLDTDIIQNSKEAVYLMSQVLHDIQASPTIDPETLPVVQELREQLDKVTTERDALKKNVRPVVRGEWEAITDSYGNIEGWIHKKCGRTTKEASSYCPNCGADMRG